MSRRSPRTKRHDRADAATTGALALADEPDALDRGLPVVGEVLRWVALAGTAGLIISRAYWPGEPDFRVDAGEGLATVLWLLLVSGVALAGALIGGTFRFRWSWVDLGVVGLVTIIASGAFSTIDRRPGLNQGWEWVGIGVAYLLLRYLPRTRAESTALTGILAATAVAVAVYGLYWVSFELPELQARYRANIPAALRQAQIEPGTPAQKLFEDRLLGSSEATGTFALANSLAGFLVGPLVVILGLAWETLTHRGGRRNRFTALLLAAVPTLAVVVCFELTKCRSAYIGLGVGLTTLAIRSLGRVRTRTVVIGGVAVAVVAGALVAAGLLTGRLDRKVFTESGKSLRFRQEYWAATWHAINENSQTFWHGYGPGNFSAPYVRHKLATASEDIRDPHNFVLEVWSSGGLWAVLALGAALVLGIGILFGPGSGGPVEPETPEGPRTAPRAREPDDPAPAPRNPAWLVVAAGILGWLAAWLIGRLDPVAGFDRWMILGGAWVLTALCGQVLWTRRPIAPYVLGAAVLATFVHLLAAGGIGIPPVALMAWSLLALGLNLREEHGSGRLRELGGLTNGRLAAFGLAAVLAALLGTFYSTVVPHWRTEAALARAEDALTRTPPAYDQALSALEEGAEADRYSARPYQRMAEVQFEVWTRRGAKPGDRRWETVPYLLAKAVEPPRAPNSWVRHRQRARWTTLILKQLEGNISPREALKYRADVVHASRTAARLYPTNAALQAWLAEASGEIGMIPDAVGAGKEALRLDALTHHASRKLDPAVRQWLEAKVPEWEKAAAEPKPAPKK